MFDIQIGIDIQKISDFLHADSNSGRRIYSKIFNDEEIKLIENLNIEQLAGRFCCKEAVIKALYGFDIKLNYKDITISKRGKKPFAQIKDNKQLSINISMSHSKEFATAVAVVWRK